MKHLLLTTIAAVLLVGCYPKMSGKRQKWWEDNIFSWLPTWVWVSIVVGGILFFWGKYLQSKRSIKGAIHHAARTGDIEIVKQALNYGADVNAVSLHGGTLLHHAALNNHNQVVQLLVAKGADINAKDTDGGTPLDRAAGELAGLLRENGAKHGTILGAVIAGDIEAVKEFLNTGAKVNIRDRFGKSLVDEASFCKHPEIADLLRKHGGKTRAELKAAGN